MKRHRFDIRKSADILFGRENRPTEEEIKGYDTLLNERCKLFFPDYESEELILNLQREIEVDEASEELTNILIDEIKEEVYVAFKEKESYITLPRMFLFLKRPSSASAKIPSIFLSHNQHDDRFADCLASYIHKYCQLYLWLDHLAMPQNSTQLPTRVVVNIIMRAIYNTGSFMALWTQNIEPSTWWVPFEVGCASGVKRNIITYDDKTASIPDYLNIHTVVSNIQDLIKACNSLNLIGVACPPNLRQCPPSTLGSQPWP